ncbi:MULTISPECIES: ABC transporter ATP-binding protein [Paenibacillus]|uniref:ABC transporter related protein n=2 Tax=Paenibacillus lactis TaxID=228574 RepID=G4HI97_9BACL|nr:MULTISPECIES: ABC transporter ATP-binding protein [Paenibacillus]EHB63070.1 ABC transporter related protein [Paenibacillus lactis 154]MBP1894799.1 peptide/nickel transport system ATP-binding protein [Paenibacillus lactis]GIO92771.1 dipeptide/oligopeptide/nickel ABC transporter ATP-binding protein [Paenibacillus lactis]HAG00262.1 ABC transporter ATP-binding protein [Paenibacillus lactis]
MKGNNVLIEGKNLTKVFGFGGNKTTAVDNVSFAFHEGEIISIVGESGSGKTTLAKLIMGLLKESAGTIEYMGKPRRLKRHSDRRKYWKHIQAIFQDPFSSFNQFYRVEKLLLDCIKLQGEKLTKEEQLRRMKEACSFVNLKYEELHNKYPFELSGGQMQRLMIARIFILHPKLLIADEPTSMVDACSRSTILDMLLKLREENNMTIIFITHDVGLAYYVSDTLYIMEQGKVVEKGPAEEVILNPKHPYTRQLISDVPKIHSEWDLA